MACGGPDITAVKLSLKQLNDTHADSEEDLGNAVEMQANAFRYAIAEAYLDNFLEQSSLPAHEWERIRDDVLVAHERLPLDEAAYMAANETAEDFDVEEIDFAAAGVTTPQQAFMHAVTKQNLVRRLKYLGAVSEPFAAKLYYFDGTPH